MLADYKDARNVSAKLQDNIFDLGDGEIDFPGCHRVLKSIAFKGWLCVDLDMARQGPRASYERCGGVRGRTSSSRSMSEPRADVRLLGATCQPERSRRRLPHPRSPRSRLEARPRVPVRQRSATSPARDARPETLLELMKANGVARTVIIQVIHYRYDNRYPGRTC